MTSERKTCDDCGSLKPRYTVRTDPPRRLCRKCSWADKLIDIGNVTRISDRAIEYSLGVPAWMMGKVGP